MLVPTLRKNIKALALAVQKLFVRLELTKLKFYDKFSRLYIAEILPKRQNISYVDT